MNLIEYIEKLPIGVLISITHLSKDMAHKKYGPETKEWNTCITESTSFCDTCNQPNSYAYYKGTGDTLQEALSKSIVELENYKIALNGNQTK